MFANTEYLQNLKMEAQREVELLVGLGRKILRVSELCDSLMKKAAPTGSPVNATDAEWRELFHLVREVQQEKEGPPLGMAWMNRKLSPELIASLRREINEPDIIAQLNEIHTTGGLELTQFYGELEKIEATHG